MSRVQTWGSTEGVLICCKAMLALTICTKHGLAGIDLVCCRKFYSKRESIPLKRSQKLQTQKLGQTSASVLAQARGRGCLPGACQMCPAPPEAHCWPAAGLMLQPPAPQLPWLLLPGLSLPDTWPAASVDPAPCQPVNVQSVSPFKQNPLLKGFDLTNDNISKKKR